ncbi:MAG: MBL fold metallo-hydrolase, partial [bacterium]|nr:MBL fold metallo-hydrolase [bacterium]
KINDGAFRFLVNTHPHGDHTSGNNIADERTVLINFESLERLVSDKIISVGNGRVTGKTGEGFERYYTLDFNEEEIRIIPNPGLHSNDDIMIWFSGSGVVHMGDILLSESFPSIDNVEGYLEFLDVVLDVYPEETIFVSGHGKDLDHNGVKDYQDMLKTTVEIITEEMKKGKSVEEIKEDRVLRDYESYSIFLDFLNTNTWIETVYRSYRDRF